MPQGFAEGNIMDDRCGTQRLPRPKWRHHVRTMAARDTEVFRACGGALTAAGLRINAKHLRREVVWEARDQQGAGDVGLVGPNRSKLMQLAKLTLQVADTGAATEAMLGSQWLLGILSVIPPLPHLAGLVSVSRVPPPGSGKRAI